MENSCNNNLAAVRIVQTVHEMRTIPCSERLNGMLVLVVETGYRTYQLKGGDPCNNNSWKDITVDNTFLAERVGHVTEEVPTVVGTLKDVYFNEKYPNAIEGFRVTVESLNTTFMKISANRWVMLGTFNYADDE